LWRQLTLPVSVQLSQTLASAATTLNLGDQVKVVPCTDAPRRIDLKV
jgi:hypothetical protein